MHPIFVALHNGNTIASYVNELSGHVPEISIVTTEPALWLKQPNLQKIIEEKRARKYKNDGLYTPMQDEFGDVRPLPLTNKILSQTKIYSHISNTPVEHAINVQKFYTGLDTESILLTAQPELFAEYKQVVYATVGSSVSTDDTLFSIHNESELIRKLR